MSVVSDNHNMAAPSNGCGRTVMTTIAHLAVFVLAAQCVLPVTTILPTIWYGVGAGDVSNAVPGIVYILAGLVTMLNVSAMIATMLTRSLPRLPNSGNSDRQQPRFLGCGCRMSYAVTIVVQLMALIAVSASVAIETLYVRLPYSSDTPAGTPFGRSVNSPSSPASVESPIQKANLHYWQSMVFTQLVVNTVITAVSLPCLQYCVSILDFAYLKYTKRDTQSCDQTSALLRWLTRRFGTMIMMVLAVAFQFFPHYSVNIQNVVLVLLIKCTLVIVTMVVTFSSTIMGGANPIELFGPTDEVVLLGHVMMRDEEAVVAAIRGDNEQPHDTESEDTMTANSVEETNESSQTEATDENLSSSTSS